MRLKEKSRIMDLLLRWNKELKIQNALGTGGANYTVPWGQWAEWDMSVTTPTAINHTRDGGQMSVRALHGYHAVAIVGMYHKDTPVIECLPVKWSKSRGWETKVSSRAGSVIVPVTIEELEAM